MVSARYIPPGVYASSLAQNFAVFNEFRQHTQQIFALFVNQSPLLSFPSPQAQNIQLPTRFKPIKMDASLCIQGSIHDENPFFNFEPVPRKPGAYPSVQVFFKSNSLCLFAEREFIVHLKRGKQLLHHFVCNGTDVEARNQRHNLPLFFLRHAINAQCQLQKAL